MGNHSVGAAFASAAEVFWEMAGDDPVTKEKALACLDKVGTRFRGADAEFDDYLDCEGQPLHRLVVLAFDATPEEVADDEKWCDGPRERFCSRYSFC